MTKPHDDNPWQTLSGKIVYQNPWMTVREDQVITPGGTRGIYGVVEAKSGVFVIALAADRAAYLINAFRYPTKKWQWELPSGGIDAGDEPLAAAQKELAEELGMAAGAWTQIGVFGPSYNGCLVDQEYVFVAEQLRSGKHHREAGEAIREVKSVSFEEIEAMIARGELADGQTLAALMQYKIWRAQQSAK